MVIKTKSCKKELKDNKIICRRIRCDRGFTIISLAVTIIVLLILTGITIKISSGNNGMIKSTKKSVAIYENAFKDESEILNEYARRFNTFNVKNSEDDIPDASTIKLTPDVTNWTNGNVSVVVSTTVTGYTLQTSTDGHTWGTTNPLIYTANGAAYARLLNKDDASSVATFNVMNIDKLPPTNTAPTAKSTSNEITVTLNQTDAPATSSYGQSRIRSSETRYAIKKSSDATWGAWQNNNSFTGLNPGTSYDIKTRVSDNAGNLSESNVLTVSTTISEITIGTKVGTTKVDGQTLNWYLFYTDKKAKKAYLVSNPTYWVPDTSKEVNGAYPPKLVSSFNSGTYAMRQAIQKVGTNSYSLSSVTYKPSQDSFNYFKRVNSQWSAQRGNIDLEKDEFKTKLNENEQAACYLADADIFAGIKEQVNNADGNLKGKIEKLVGGASAEQWANAYNNQKIVKDDPTKK